jgi:hypothetical protein
MADLPFALVLQKTRRFPTCTISSKPLRGRQWPLPPLCAPLLLPCTAPHQAPVLPSLRFRALQAVLFPL